MALDDKAVERMLKAQREALEPSRNTPGADNPHLFEEFQRPAKPGEPPKPKGLNAQGYRFPPPGPADTPAMTKENLAKGIGLPAAGKPAAPPPSELVQADPLFEEYQRPDLKHKPRTGQGLRHATIPKTAKEILQGYEPPTPQVFTPKRLDGSAPPMPVAPAATAAPAKAAAPVPAPVSAPAAPAPAPSTPAVAPPVTASQQEVAAHLDAEADLASAPPLTMSHSRAHGPMKTVTEDDPFTEMPALPGAGAPAAARKGAAATNAERPARGPSAPHVSDAPAVEPGDGPRIGLVQADFNFGITTAMADLARQAAQQLGTRVVHHVHVPGVFDVPLTAKVLARRNDVDAVVVVGCVIQGETGHDQIIATECARKLADLAYESEKPVGLAVTGPRMTAEAAEARIDAAAHAVASVVKQWRTLKALGAARLVAQ